MAVKVRTTKSKPSAGIVTDEIAQGTQVAVIDGHLHVSDSGNRYIAIYAPEKWTEAKVEEA